MGSDRLTGSERASPRCRYRIPCERITLKDDYLEVAYPKGKPLAAYLYLPPSVGAKSTRTQEAIS